MQYHIKKVNVATRFFVMPNVVICMKGLQEVPGLSAGKHSLKIQFVPSSSLSSKTLELEPFISFTVFSKGDSQLLIFMYV